MLNLQIKEIFRGIYSYFTISNFNIRTINVGEDEKYLNLLSKKYRNVISRDNNMESYFYRSFLQYKCQVYRLPLFNKLLINFFSIFIILLYIFILIFCSIFNKNKKLNNKKNSKVAVIANKLDKELIPHSIIRRYLIENSISRGFLLDKDGFLFLLILVKKFYFYPYFILKSIVKITFYSYLCNQYVPEAIITTSEYSFTSSILTAYLKQKGILHINVMHGEKLFFIRDSFFRFSECWVWSRDYIELFLKLCAYSKQFKIEIPPKHKRLIKGSSLINKNKRLKVYWARENDKEEVEYIFRKLNKLKKAGFEIIIRYHPLHKGLFFHVLKPYCNNFQIENPTKNNIYDSLMETHYVLATHSTLLLEANLMGRVVVVNDFGENLEKLKRLNYILVKKGQYIPFSKLLKDFRCN